MKSPREQQAICFLISQAGRGRDEGQGLGAVLTGLPKPPQAGRPEMPHPLWASTGPFSGHPTLPHWTWPSASSRPDGVKGSMAWKLGAGAWTTPSGAKSWLRLCNHTPSGLGQGSPVSWDLEWG